MEPPDPLAAARVVFLIVLAMVASGVVWWVTGILWLAGQRVLPYQRRRPVPWGAFEAIALVGIFIVSPVVVAFIGMAALDIHVPDRAARAATEPDLGHVIVQLLRQEDSAAVLVAAALLTVVVAPVVEELIFRVVLQGWLENVERRLRRRARIRLGWAAGMAPVLTSSLLFAAMHFRTAEPALDANLLTFLVGCQGVASLLTLALGWVLLRLGSGATAADLGFAGKHLAGDVRLGLVAWLAATGPVYVVMIAAAATAAGLGLGDKFAPDPFPLFFLALMLGALCYRTHRVVPAIVLHMAFNATGLLMFAVSR